MHGSDRPSLMQIIRDPFLHEFVTKMLFSQQIAQHAAKQSFPCRMAGDGFICSFILVLGIERLGPQNVQALLQFKVPDDLRLGIGDIFD